MSNDEPTARPEPTREEALRWMVATGGAPSECVAALWGDLPKEERVRVVARVKKWAQRARDAAPPLHRPGVAAPPPPAAPERPPSPTPDMPRPDFLRAQLAQVLYDADLARAQGKLQLVPALDRRVTEVRDELDDELSRTRGAVQIEQTPGAILAEVDRRATALTLRREMAQRRAAREAAAAQREAEGGGAAPAGEEVA